jgi:hypothetical protein
MKGMPLNVDIDEAGEFRCVPDSSACEDKEGARTILDIFRKMPEDRRAVWVSRLDHEETFKRCPVIKKDPVLSKEFDECYVAYGKSKRRTNQTDQQQDGGEKGK